MFACQAKSTDVQVSGSGFKSQVNASSQQSPSFPPRWGGTLGLYPNSLLVRFLFLNNFIYLDL